jgi:phenylacetate-CoA ligase
MRPLNWLYLNALLPLSQGQKSRGLGGLFREYSSMERLPREVIRGRQWANVQAICQHAYDSVPFYRARFDAVGIRPADLRTPSDLCNLPYLTREDIRQNLPDLWSRKYKLNDLQVAATGGTTDVPVKLYRDAEVEPKKNAKKTPCNGL